MVKEYLRMMTQNCSILIPARMESSRLPGKPLKLIEGIPMIVHVAKRASLYEHASQVIVCTDSAEIILECEKYVVDVINTSNRHRNGTTRIAEAARILNLPADHIIIDVQGDEPLVRPEYIESVHQFLLNTKYGCCVPFQFLEEFNNKNRVKVISTGDRVLYLTRSDAPTYFSTPFGGYKKHLSIVGFRHETLQNYVSLPVGELEAIEHIELLRLIEHQVQVGTFEMNGASIAVDTPEDLELVRRIMEKDDIFKYEMGI